MLINVYFAGRLNDETKLAGVGLGTTINHVLAMSIISGVANAMDTLVSQTYGSGNLKLIGVYLNRARVICTLAFVPLAILVFNAKTLLLAVGQDPDTV